MVMTCTLKLGFGRVIGSDGPLSLPGQPSLERHPMSNARPVHQQQLPTVGSVAWLIIAVLFILSVVAVLGALTLLGC